MKSKLAQTASAAGVVGVIALVLIIYIVLIPGIKDSINGGSSSGGSSAGGTTSGSTLVNGSRPLNYVDQFSFPGPGLVDSSTNGRQIILPTLNLKTTTNSKILASDNSFYVYKTFFGNDKRKSIMFDIKDSEQISNAQISFLVKKSYGMIYIDLNGVRIYEDELSSMNINPIKVSSALFQKNNLLEIYTDYPGIVFWRQHQYIIDDFKLFADVTQTSQQSSLVSFDLKPSEFKSLSRLKLKFYPTCTQSTVDKLYVSLNGQTISEQVPDCNVLNIYDLPQIQTKEGMNTIEFKTLKDSYLVDQLSVQTELKENDDLIYTFDLDKKLFNFKEEAKNVCGELDGVCPDSCTADQDKDCCFLEYNKGFWCTAPTLNENDKCVGRVDNYNIGLCPSGYEDKSKNPPTDFENLCGDDTDGTCPLGCSKFMDKDCCFENTGYWCSDVATNGMAGVCVDVVTKDSCSFCPSGYKGEDSTPTCDGYETRNPMEEVSQLKSTYQADVQLRFVDDGNRKKGKIIVDGSTISFTTLEGTYTKEISTLVQDGNNYVQIVPESDFNLVNVKVTVK